MVVPCCCMMLLSPFEDVAIGPCEKGGHHALDSCGGIHDGRTILQDITGTCVYKWLPITLLVACRRLCSMCLGNALSIRSFVVLSLLSVPLEFFQFALVTVHLLE